MKLILYKDRFKNETILLNSFSNDCILRCIDDYPDIDNLVDSVDNIKYLVLIYHFPGYYRIPFYEDSFEYLLTNIPEYRYFSDNFIKLIVKLQTRNSNLVLDILTCNMNSIEFINEVNIIKNNLNINIRYSIDETGNMLGGNWVLESDNVNVKNLYFTDNINLWNGILTGDVRNTIITNGNYRGISFSNNVFTLNNNTTWLADEFISLQSGERFDGQYYKITIISNGSFQSSSFGGLFTMSNILNLTSAPIIENLGIIGNGLDNISGYFVRGGQNRFIVRNCIQKGIINNNWSGGIAGNEPGYLGEAIIYNCITTGEISGGACGGIVGTGAARDGICIIFNCITTGNITGSNSGGITGFATPGGGPGIAVISQCYVTGSVSGYNCGSITGPGTGGTSVCIVSQCYTDNPSNVDTNYYYSGSPAVNGNYPLSSLIGNVGFLNSAKDITFGSIINTKQWYNNSEFNLNVHWNWPDVKGIIDLSLYSTNAFVIVSGGLPKLFFSDTFNFDIELTLTNNIGNNYTLRYLDPPFNLNIISAIDENNNNISNLSYIYTSSDVDILTVNQSGLVSTSNFSGNANILISVSTNGYRGSSVLNVNVLKAIGLLSNLNINSITYSGFQNLAFTAPNTNSDSVITYTSSNTFVASFSNNSQSLLNINNAGFTQITATISEHYNYTSNIISTNLIINRGNVNLMSDLISSTIYSPNANFTFNPPITNSNGQFTYYPISNNIIIPNPNINTLQILNAGIATILASQSDTNNYYGGNINLSVQIDKAFGYLNSFTLEDQLYNNITSNYTFISPTSNSGGNIVYTSSNILVADFSNNMSNTLNIYSDGFTQITANLQDTNNYSGGSLQISNLLVLLNVDNLSNSLQLVGKNVGGNFDNFINLVSNANVDLSTTNITRLNNLSNINNLSISKKLQLLNNYNNRTINNLNPINVLGSHLIEYYNYKGINLPNFVYYRNIDVILPNSFGNIISPSIINITTEQLNVQNNNGGIFISTDIDEAYSLYYNGNLILDNKNTFCKFSDGNKYLDRTSNTWNIYTPSVLEISNNLLGYFYMGSGTLLNVDESCFEANTNIVCLVNNESKNIKIKDIKVGDLVLTYSNGYLPVIKILRSRLVNNPYDDSINSINKCLYINKNTGLRVSGGHPIIIDKLSDYQEKMMKIWFGENYNNTIEGLHTVLACWHNDFSKVISESSFDLYQLILESSNDNDVYAVYSDNILGGTSSLQWYNNICGL